MLNLNVDFELDMMFFAGFEGVTFPYNIVTVVQFAIGDCSS
jgi:hypothetical protein